jgi:hypothetical protein
MSAQKITKLTLKRFSHAVVIYFMDKCNKLISCVRLNVSDRKFQFACIPFSSRLNFNARFGEKKIELQISFSTISLIIFSYSFSWLLFLLGDQSWPLGLDAPPALNAKRPNIAALMRKVR